MQLKIEKKSGKMTQPLPQIPFFMGLSAKLRRLDGGAENKDMKMADHQNVQA